MTGLELKIERIRARKKQFEVAGAIGICPTILCDIENGRRGIEPELLQRILKFLQKDYSPDLTRLLELEPES